jgi:hypothetical protein
MRVAFLSIDFKAILKALIDFCWLSSPLSYTNKALNTEHLLYEQ